MAAISSPTPNNTHVSNMVRALRGRECGGKSRVINEAIEVQAVKNISSDCFRSYAQQIERGPIQLSRSDRWVAIEDPETVSLYDPLLGRKVWSCSSPRKEPSWFDKFQVDTKGTIARGPQWREHGGRVEIFQAGKKTGLISHQLYIDYALVADGKIFVIGPDPDEDVIPNQQKRPSAFYYYDHTGTLLKKISLKELGEAFQYRLVNANYCVIINSSHRVFVFDCRKGSHEIFGIEFARDERTSIQPTLEGNHLLMGATNLHWDACILAFDLLKGCVVKEYAAGRGKIEGLIADKNSVFCEVSHEYSKSIYAIDLLTRVRRSFLKLGRFDRAELSVTGPLLSVCVTDAGQNVQTTRYVFDTETGEQKTKTPYDIPRHEQMSDHSGVVLVPDTESNKFYVETFYPTP